MTEQLLSEPCDYDSEKALLSAMIRDSSLIDNFSDQDADIFYMPAHRSIFGELLRIRRAKEPIDFVLVLGRLREDGLEEEIGGKEYLSSIWEYVPTAAAWRYYWETLIEKLDLRRALAMARRISEIAYDQKPNLSEIERTANSYKLTPRHQEDIATVANIVVDLSEYLEKVQDGTLNDPGIDWGFGEMDSLIDKIRPGELCLVGGFPGSGKTSILNSVVAHTCVPNKLPALIFSLEMPTLDEVMRLVSIAGRIPIARMRRAGGMNQEDIALFSEASQAVHGSKVAIVDDILTIQEIYAKAKEYKERHGLEFLGIDHAQLVRISGTGERARYQGLDEVGRASKYMAKELGIPVMLLTQINRMDQSPFECSALEAHADQFMIVPKTDIKNVEVRKNRNGPKGFVELNFYPECAAFY